LNNDLYWTETFFPSTLGKKKGGGKMGKLTGKKLLLLGERDGVPGPAMEACLKGSGASIEFSVTECFV